MGFSMPVHHFTFHAYRDWRPDNPKGYLRKHRGYHAPDSDMAAKYDEAAKQPAVQFDRSIQVEILVLSHQICAEEGWRLEGAGFDEGHVHLVVSWEGDAAWEEVDRRLKNLLVLKLNREHGAPGKRWFGRRHGFPKRVRDREHLRHLMEEYLPGHPGVFWRRGMPLPNSTSRE